MARRRGFVVVSVPEGDWLSHILPGFEARADQGYIVQIKADRVVIDRRRQKEYNKDGAGEGEGA